MKIFLTLMLLIGVAQTGQAAGDTTWEAPIAPDHAITIDGRYFKATDGSPALFFKNNTNNELVVVRNCVFHGNGEDIVKSIGFVNVIFENNYVIADDPLPGKQRGRINMYQPRVFDCQHNTCVNTGGIFVDGFTGYLPEHRIQIGFNLIINTDKRRADGTDGSHRASVQVSTARKTANIRIFWNKIISQENRVSSEDGINIYNSNAYGTGGRVRVDSNLIYGQYPYPANADKFSGSGMTVDGYVSRDGNGNPTDGYTPETAAGDVEIVGNTVLEVGNAAGNIMNGGRSRIHGNVFLNTGYLNNGEKWYRSWSGTDILNSSNQPATTFYGNSIDSNVIAFRSWGQKYPYPDRQDENDVSDWAGNRTQNEMPRGRNFYLPYGYPTKATIDSAVAAWEKTLSGRGYYVGANKLSTPPLVTTIVTTDSTIKLNSTVTGSIRPVNVNGGTATAKDGTVVYKSSNPAICSVVKDSTNQLAFTIRGVKLGRVLLTITYTNAADETVTATYPVNVVLSELPGVGMEMHLNQ